MSDAKQIMRMFKAIARVRTNAQEMRQYGNIVREEKDKQFERGESPDGNEKWAGLKEETIRRKSGKTTTTRKWVQNRQGNKFVKGGDFKDVKVKNKSANAAKPLIATEQMKSMYISEATNDHVVISMAKSRSTGVSSGGESIAEIHEKGLGKGNKPRRHIGIPIAARKRIEEQFLRKINQTIRSIVDAHK